MSDIERAAKALVAHRDMDAPRDEAWHRREVDLFDALRAATDAHGGEDRPVHRDDEWWIRRINEAHKHGGLPWLVAVAKNFPRDEGASATPTGAGEGTRGCVVAFCADHAEVEIIPGPFCPVCSMGDVLRDGVKLGREAKLPATETKCPTCGSDHRRVRNIVGEATHSVDAGTECYDRWHHEDTPRAGASEGEGTPRAEAGGGADIETMFATLRDSILRGLPGLVRDRATVLGNPQRRIILDAIEAARADERERCADAAGEAIQTAGERLIAEGREAHEHRRRNDDDPGARLRSDGLAVIGVRDSVEAAIRALPADRERGGGG